MTIVISPGMAGALASAGTENNPMILWENFAADAAWTTTDGTEIESATNLQTPSTFDRWIADTDGSGDVQANALLTASRTFNIVCLAAHSISDFGGNVSIETSIDGGTSYQDAGAGVVVPTDNQAICFVFNEAPNTDRWRISIQGAVALSRLSVGVAFFGTILTVPQRLYQGYTPPITPTRVDLQSNVSEGGNLLGSSVIRKGSTTVANLTHLLPSFIRDFNTNGWANFQNHFNDGGGAFWLWRPTQFQDGFYAWRNGEPIIPTNSGPKGYMSVSMAMRMFDDP